MDVFALCSLYTSSSITQSMDSGGTDNFILISQLKEEVLSLKRLLQQRDQTILEKDRKVGIVRSPLSIYLLICIHLMLVYTFRL